MEQQGIESKNIANLEGDRMDLHENLGGLRLRDRRFLQGKVVEPVHLWEAVLAGGFRKIHDGEMFTDRM